MRYNYIRANKGLCVIRIPYKIRDIITLHSFQYMKKKFQSLFVLTHFNFVKRTKCYFAAVIVTVCVIHFHISSFSDFLCSPMHCLDCQYFFICRNSAQYSSLREGIFLNCIINFFFWPNKIQPNNGHYSPIYYLAKKNIIIYFKKIPFCILEYKQNFCKIKVLAILTMHKRAMGITA